MKINKKYSFFFLFIILFIVLLSVFGVKIYKNLNNYKVDSRVNKLNKVKKDYKDYDFVGWLKVQGTNIDYPILYNSSSVDVSKIGEFNFVWTNKYSKKVTNRMFIAGHNIRNVSSFPIITDPNHERFEQLMSFVYYDFAKDNKYIQYTIDGKDYVYKIFSVSFVEDSTLDYYSNSYSKNELNTYIKQSIEDSYYKYDIDVNKNDDVITLITCTRMFGYNSDKTFKIDARSVRDGELLDNYKVSEKENYKEIKEILKGDGSNEEA